MKKKRFRQSASFNLPVVLAALVCAATCSIVAGTLLAFFQSEAPPIASGRTLTFAERVAYQRGIEEVYWQHRIWPKQRPDPKPSLDAVMSQAQIEGKVTEYLRESQALADYWQQPITAEQLQTEMDRMAQYTKHPEVLRELFAALGNDPFVIAECLARPILSERLIRDFQGPEQRSHGDLKSRAGSWGVSAGHQTLNRTTAAGARYRLPAISDGAACSDNTWTSTSTTNAPSPRAGHTAVWTGSEVIVWGGGNSNSYFNTGGRYNPGTDSWTATSISNAPTGRSGHTAAWTGSEMIIWGGYDGAYLNTGARYNPGMDSWIATSTTNAPGGRQDCTAVWTGSELIVWGGYDGAYLNTGARYNLGMDSWSATSTTNAPQGRYEHAATWTGSEMIVWGGFFGGIPLNDGGKYNPGTDSWTATSTTSAPSPRGFPTAVWTSSEMIIWGGWDDINFLNTGGRYKPDTDTWTATSTTSAPTGRFQHTAVWTGSEMIVWGGTDGLQQFDTGGRYNPGTDNWMATTTTNAPERRAYHTAVWSGSEMIVWGGFNDIGPFYLNTGGRYCAQSGPTPTPTATPTPTPGESCLVEQVSSCGTIVSNAPTDFTVEMSCPVDVVQPSGFMVNNIGPNSFAVSKSTITFHYNTSPAVPGLNTIHILNDAITCCIRPVNEFTCTFFYEVPRPTPTARPRPSPAPRP